MNFDEALRYLLDLGHETLTIKLGLNNTELLLKELGDPQSSFPSVQIAGTNGKGSTAVFLDAVCRAAGINSGLYTSPHLVSITERIKIGGREISKEYFSHSATEVRMASEQLLGSGVLPSLPTFFEQVTAIALSAFKDRGVKLAILETGLGGRLDATTLARADTVALTPIALEHQEYLGNTIADIAGEKAAIIRPGVTAIVAPQTPEAMKVIQHQCDVQGVKPLVNDCKVSIETTTIDGRFRVIMQSPEDRYEMTLGLRGRHQITNAALALRLAESLRQKGFQISRSAIIEGIETANHPGRLELIARPPAILLDGAHNPSGARALRNYLDEFVRKPITLIFGVMNDKKVDEMAQVLFPAAQHVIVTEPDNPRATPVEILERVAKRFVDPERVTGATSADDAFQLALKVTPNDGVICVTGSLYLLGDLKNWIGHHGL